MLTILMKLICIPNFFLPASLVKYNLIKYFFFFKANLAELVLLTSWNSCEEQTCALLVFLASKDHQSLGKQNGTNFIRGAAGGGPAEHRIHCIHSSALKYPQIHCSILQCTAMHCSALRCSENCNSFEKIKVAFKHPAMHSNSLQCTQTQYNAI